MWGGGGEKMRRRKGDSWQWLRGWVVLPPRGRTDWPHGGRTRKPRRPKQGSPHRGCFSARSNPRKHFLCDDALKRWRSAALADQRIVGGSGCRNQLGWAVITVAVAIAYIALNNLQTILKLRWLIIPQNATNRIPQKLIKTPVQTVIDLMKCFDSDYLTSKAKKSI